MALNRGSLSLSKFSNVGLSQLAHLTEFSHMRSAWLFS